MCNDGWVAMNWEGTTPLGVRRSLPFCNREVLELAFRCHPADLLGPGPKRLLRVALSGDVPPRNLFRPDKGVSSNPLEAKKAFEFLPSRMPKGAERIIRPDWLPTPPARVDADLVQLLGPLSVARWLEDRSRPGHASNG
jgi:hypothetical protein